VGKLLILDASFETSVAAWIWSVILIASLISILGFARAGSVLYWKAKSVPPPEEGIRPEQMPSRLSYVAVGGLLALLILHTVFAGPVHRYATQTAQALFAPDAYISTVLDTPGKLSKPKEEK
jgi:multicomponent K+:H+ antiporter subunit D